MEFVEIFGLISMVTSWLLFASPYRDIQRMKQARDVGESSILPYNLMSCVGIIWTIYGMSRRNGLVIITNFFGAACGVYFSFVFFQLARARVRAGASIAASGTALLILFSIVLSVSAESGETVLGIAGNIASISLFASPLVNIRNVLRTKSTESISLGFAIAALVCSFSWTMYGLLIEDTFIALPNSLSFIVSAIQMGLFLFFCRRSRDVVDVGLLNRGGPLMLNSNDRVKPRTIHV